MPRRTSSDARATESGRLSSRQASHWQRMNRHATEIDVGATEHWVAVPDDRAAQPVQRFGAFTADLYALAAWLNYRV
jgi:hypothetical protein